MPASYRHLHFTSQQTLVPYQDSATTTPRPPPGPAFRPAGALAARALVSSACSSASGSLPWQAVLLEQVHGTGFPAYRGCTALHFMEGPCLSPHLAVETAGCSCLVATVENDARHAGARLRVEFKSTALNSGRTDPGPDLLAHVAGLCIFIFILY